MVASRWPQRLDFLAAAIKRSISAVVRYSRVRTEEFKCLVPTGRPCVFPRYFARVSNQLVNRCFLSSVNRSVGIHGQPWPQVSQPVWPQQVLPPARVTVSPWPHASTMIQWRRDEPAEWFVSADADCSKCLQNMTSGKCQKTADTSNRSHDHTPTRPSKRWPA